jgi:hypothetical protein
MDRAEPRKSGTAMEDKAGSIRKQTSALNDCEWRLLQLIYVFIVVPSASTTYAIKAIQCALGVRYGMKNK